MVSNWRWFKKNTYTHKHNTHIQYIRRKKKKKIKMQTKKRDIFPKKCRETKNTNKKITQ